MTTKAEQRIEVGGIYFKNPLKEDAPSATETIVISRKRFDLIQFGMSSLIPGSPISTQEYYRLLERGHNIANALMPGLLNHILKDALTPTQYERALRANRERKLLKFARAKK